MTGLYGRRPFPVSAQRTPASCNGATAQRTAEAESDDQEGASGHGSDPTKYLVTSMIGRRNPLVFYAIGTDEGRTDMHAQLLLWRTLARRVDRVIACDER